MNIALFLGQALLGWLIADFFSGLFHWYEDRVGRTDWPVLGKWVIEPNRRHHTDPLDFTYGNVLRRNLIVWLIVCLVGAGWAFSLGMGVTWGFAVAGGLVVNEIHRAAHRPKDYPVWVRVLQDTGLIQSPQQHARHHRAPSDRIYCVLTDFLNPALDQLRFWDRLEDGLTWLGLEPNRGGA